MSAKKEIKKVVVLKGGWNGERDVSLSSAVGIAAALKKLGYLVKELDITYDGVLPFIEQLKSFEPDVAFNALHGYGGEDGVIQGLLEMMHIPYTHSGVLSSALAMNKVQSRLVLDKNGLKVPSWCLINPCDIRTFKEFNYPYVMKPISDGSSKGVYIVKSDEDLENVDVSYFKEDKVLVEKFVSGREIQIGIMGDKALGAIEIKPKVEFYSYEAKYTDGLAEHIMPAPLSKELYEKALTEGLKAHKALGCKSVSRVDTIMDEEGNFIVLEVNTQPGFTPTSLLPEIASYAGISFEQLINWMVEKASCEL
ncbi:MAG TPA: D-alanine--D-alanine ligase [Alphaproteobacteria bacterium]|nr:D-alanine--D-alanine ligase [Alphaproteobacteria bacterium]